mgnify:CR=1 FL=1
MDSQVWLIIIGLGGYGVLFLVAFLKCICKSTSEEDHRVEVNIRFDSGIYINNILKEMTKKYRIKVNTVKAKKSYGLVKKHGKIPLIWD